ncbi:hypothetical protein D3C72_2311780 [compost metagenome]
MPVGILVSGDEAAPATQSSAFNGLAGSRSKVKALALRNNLMFMGVFLDGGGDGRFLHESGSEAMGRR